MSLLSDIFAHPDDRIAVITERGPVTYGQMRADVERTAAYLHGQGVGVGTAVGVHTGLFRQADDYAAWIAHLATIHLGAAHASVHDAAMLKDLTAAGVIDLVIGCQPMGSGEGVRIVPLNLASLPVPSTVPDRQDAATTRINLTSGTTGTPKVVRWSGEVIGARVRQVTDLGLIGPEAIVDSILGPRTTAGFRYPLATWIAGGRVLLSRGSARAPTGQSTILVCSPFQLQAIRHRRQRWPNADNRTVIALGGRVAPGLRDWILANIASRVIISFGSTEAGNIAHGDATMVDRHPGAVGWIRNDVELEIVDSNGQPAPTGQEGSLRLRTPTMCRAEGSLASADGWFEPGDIAILYGDGLLAIGGRSSDVINLGGMKLSATELETHLLAAGDVRDCAVVTLPTPDGERLVVAIVPNGRKPPRDYAGHLKSKLPQSLQYRIVLVNRIPRNAMGKIDRPGIVRQLVANNRAANRKVQRDHA